MVIAHSRFGPYQLDPIRTTARYLKAMGLARGGATTAAPTPTKVRRPRRPKTIKLGSDFTGLDPAAVALRRMGVPFQVAFASDVANP